MAAGVLRLNYRSIDQFIRHYERLIQGKIFLKSASPLAEKTPLILNIDVPGIEQTVPLDAIVLKRLDAETADRLNKPTGMVLGFREPPEVALALLNKTLAANDHYRAILNLPSHPQENPNKETDIAPGAAAAGQDFQHASDSRKKKPEVDRIGPQNTPHGAVGSDDLEQTRPQADDQPGLSMKWIRNAISQEEAAREEEAFQEIAPAVSDKKELTPEERNRVKPVADFIMDLTKAMLRTGYYESSHPGAENAKRGLFEAFLNSVGEAGEIMLTHQETHEITDILIIGILNEPVNVRTLVGAGMAELFFPKLSEFFKRKGLVTFAIRKSITPQHFEKFVDIMSDPTADQAENAQLGKLLSDALVENGITEISTVFMDDIIALEMNLPWRVEMAIPRLAKDLKVLPMFQTESDDSIKQMKLQIIQDIIRPLNHPEFLKDLIINCYVIARHLDNIESEDIEKVIIEAFPLESLLPTSRYIFDELKRLREMETADPDNPSVKRRFSVVKRILKWVARRLVLEDVGGAQHFLEQLYENGLLKFEELPSDVQYLVNTTKMAGDIRAHPDRYAGRLLQPESEDESGLVLKCFRRVLPQFIEEEDWMSIVLMAQSTSSCEKDKILSADLSAGWFSPILLVFDGQIEKLAEKHERALEEDRPLIESIFSHIGTPGIEVLSSVLSDSSSRSSRKAAMSALVGLGDLTRDWVNMILEDADSQWFIKRNALILLNSLEKEAEDPKRVRSLLRHQNARVRDEALNAMVKMGAAEAESEVIRALEDSDEKVRWRALSALPDLAPISEASMNRLLAVIQTDIHEESEAATRQQRKATQFIRAIGAMKILTNPAVAEETILAQAQKLSGAKTGFFKRLKKNQDPEKTAMLQASLTTLANIGSDLSISFLHKVATGKDQLSDTARKSAAILEQRLAQKAVST